VLKIAFREEGDAILLLDGASGDSAAVAQRAAPLQGNQREFSSSEYSRAVAGIVAGEPPAIELAAEKRLQDCLVALAADASVQSAHDISDGGIAVTLAESCFASNGLSADVKLEGSDPAEMALFGERGARAIVSLSLAMLARVLDTARQYGVAAQQIGQVTRGDAFRIEYKGRAVIDASVAMWHDTWAHSLERILKVR
jgi:phosphoribosylformylglycinamidine synthase